MRTSSSARGVLWRLGFRQTIRGAVMLGIIASSMMAIQGIAYAKSYTTMAQRQQFVTTITRAPALGIIYGEQRDLATLLPRGYMVYRTVAFLALAATIWSLMASTRLLRGNEEDGRWEVVLSGTANARQATTHMLLGFGSALALGGIVSSAITAAVGRMPDLAVSLPGALAVNAAIFAPAAFGLALGAVVSQLAISRRRALSYGLIIIMLLYVLRALGNTVSGWYWLKSITPFGWTDKLSPLLTPRPIWLLAFAVLVGVCGVIGISLAGRRDMGTSILRESDHKISRYYLLGSVWQFALRRNLGAFLLWGISTCFVGVLVAALASLAVDATAESSQLNEVLGRLASTSGTSIVHTLKLAFIGSGLLFTTFVLLFMAVSGLNDMRREEADNRADIALVGPISRQRWLLSHVLVVLAAASAIALLTGTGVWIMTVRQQLHVSLATLLSGSLQSFGAVVFVLGLGVFLYSLVPRFAMPLLYAVLAWSFTIDIVASVANLHKLLVQSSLFHYISLVPATSPNWHACVWLVSIGAALTVMGTSLFVRRDVVTD